MSRPAPQVEEVAAALQVSVRVLLRWIRQHRGDDRLSAPESAALSRLSQDGPCTSAELARREQISPQSMGVTTAALEARRLIARTPDPDYGRRVILSVTELGSQLLGDQRAARTRLLAEAMAEEFSEPELRLLMDAAPLLERLAQRP